ncbi:hypothetical protein Q3G72_004683 [Acer saccharum]|nr:hypothetical protein Q3G72_004683 [Acer saccharum]
MNHLSVFRQESTQNDNLESSRLHDGNNEMVISDVEVSPKFSCTKRRKLSEVWEDYYIEHEGKDGEAWAKVETGNNGYDDYRGITSDLDDYCGSLPFVGQLYNVSWLINTIECNCTYLRNIRNLDGFKKIKLCLDYVRETPFNEYMFAVAEDIINWGKKVTSREEEWDESEAIYDCWKALNDAVKSFSESKSQTANVYFPMYCDTYAKLLQWEVSKYKYVKGVYKKYASCFSNCSGSYKMLDHLGRPCDAEDVVSPNSEESELDRYLKEARFRSVEEIDILSRWRLNNPNFPILARMARDYLAIPFSEAVSYSSLRTNRPEIDDNIDDDCYIQILQTMVCTKSWLESQ